MANKKKPKVKIKVPDYEGVEAIDPDTGQSRLMTSEDREGQGPRERRKEDRRKADEKTSEVRRKLSDRRTTYNFEVTSEKNRSNKLGEKFRPLLDPLDREFREAYRRSGSEGAFEAALSEKKKPWVSAIRPIIKSKKGGLLGLGLAVGTAMMKGKEAYDASKEKQ